MSVSKMISVLIVHPQAEIRQRLSQQLQSDGDLDVVAQVDCGETALELCRYRDIDVVILDVVMPGLDGLTVTHLLRDAHPAIHVVIVTDIQEPRLIQMAVDMGVSGYLDRATGSERLAQTVRAAAAGLYTFSEPVVGQLVPPAANGAGTVPALPTSQTEAYMPDLYDSLTPREHQVMHLVLLGYTSSEIGRQLYISPRTAEKHRANMMGKLGVHNQMELARLAYQLGVMPLADSWDRMMSDVADTVTNLTLDADGDDVPLFDRLHPVVARSG